MPTYVYKCNNCDDIFEVFQKISDEPLKRCPVCNGELKRLISGGSGVIFKGSGFYTTDYKNPSCNISHSSENNNKKQECSTKNESVDSKPSKKENNEFSKK